MDGKNIADLFTAASVITLQGSALAAFVLANLAGKLFSGVTDRMRAWIATVVALVLQLGAAGQVADPSAMTWIVGFLNGALVAASALGINQTTTPSGGGGGGEQDGQQGGGAISTDAFRTSWL